MFHNVLGCRLLENYIGWTLNRDNHRKNLPSVDKSRALLPQTPTKISYKSYRCTNEFIIRHNGSTSSQKLAHLPIFIRYLDSGDSTRVTRSPVVLISPAFFFPRSAIVTCRTGPDRIGSKLRCSRKSLLFRTAGSKWLAGGQERSEMLVTS